MSPETLSVLGLSSEPFTKEIDDADLWLPPRAPIMKNST